MLWHWILFDLVSTGVEAFFGSPIRWGGSPPRSFVLAPTASGPNDGASLPVKLVAWDQFDHMLPEEIPYFMEMPDKTITWDATGLCLDSAGGDDGRDVIVINRCTAGPTQLWDVLPGDARGMKQIQLKDTRTCLAVNDRAGAADGAVIQLRPCEGRDMALWQFEAPIASENFPHNSRSASHVRHMSISFAALAIFGTLGFSTLLSRWFGIQRAHAVAEDQRSNVESGGVSLTAPLAAKQDSMPLTSSYDLDSQNLIPTAMALSPMHQASRLGRSGLRRLAVTMLAKQAKKKKKSDFEEYEISGEDVSPNFPLPDQRHAVRVHKKHVAKGGASASKAPAEAMPTNLRTDYPGLKILHLDPLVLTVERFFTPEECDAYRSLHKSSASHKLEQSATFSTMTANARTSSTWFVRYQDATALLARAQQLLGVPATHFEEPQLVHYASGQRFSWHYDAVPPTMLHNGGQRLATLLVYLDDVPDGGYTAFRDLRPGGTDEDGEPKRLKVAPAKGRALIFFPSAADGTPDERTLHAGESTHHEKWVAQLWLHERPYLPNVPEGSSHEEAEPAIAKYAATHGF